MSPSRDWNQMRERIIGLGEESSRKSFYPELQQRLSELEEARKELRRSEESLRTVFNTIPDAIFIVDFQGRVLEVNEAALAMYGVTRETFRDFSAADYSAWSGPGDQPPLREQLKTESHWTREWLARRPGDGSTFEVEGSLRPARWYDQDVVILVVRDVTERKRLEAMLRQSQKLDALGQFAGGLAHDTNNMLGVILGYVDLLMDKLPGDEQSLNDLAQIQKAARRSSDLIRQLMAFARKQVIQPRAVDLNDLVENTQRMMGRLIGENISLVWKPAEPLWKVWVDPSMLDQVLANLAANARDSIEGAGTITLETANLEVDEAFCHGHPGAVPGSYVLLSVTDTGHGMTPEVQARIFEPFFTTKEPGHGTGLGLPMVYGILRQHGAFITVYSTPGVGTTFRLYFPRHLGADAEQDILLDEEPLLGGHETILLVEDEENLLDLQKTILESGGYRVIPASLPSEAQILAQQNQESIDLLVTDLVMPEMNGWDFYQWLCLLRPDIKTLFMSGYPADTIQLQEALGSGREFLQKPFTRADLLRKVRHVLESEA